MAKISLREYIHNIEGLIDRGETDQAIFHCKSILKYYPKHIDSYRLLGKALLEKKKFGDAADIFQRVLSSVADDFISQIGMSIIREDENNLDAALWHMERAFETQPSNKAVQEELIKLYALRDGVAPPKIRLTRGALVRMYVKGELYTQAIAEIQAALLEDQNRVDLEIILARLYNLMGQKVEATEICSKLISKLPYCYEANLILTEILPGTGRAEDEKIFRQRVIELDPYFAFVGNANTSSLEIPDSSVMVEYLEYDGTLFDQEKPDWAESIDLDFNNDLTASDEENDNWFNFDQTQEEEENVSKEISSEISQGSSDETIISETTRSDLSDLLKSDDIMEVPLPDFVDNNEDSNLPDWIKEAGWNEAESENIESQKGFNLIEDKDIDIPDDVEDEEIIPENIEPGELPEWIKDIAPVDQIGKQDLSNGEEAVDENDEGFEKLFDKLGETSETISSINDGDDSMEWLKEFQDDSSEAPSPFDEEFDSELLPQKDSDSITSETLSEVEQDIFVNDELINKEKQDKVLKEELELINEEPFEEELPVKNDTEMFISEDTLDDKASSEKDTTTSIAWLEALSENHNINENVIENSDDKEREFPEWMSELEKETEDSSGLDEGVFQPQSSAERQEDETSYDLPDWLTVNEEENGQLKEELTNEISQDQPALDEKEMFAEIDHNELESSDWESNLAQAEGISEEEPENSEEIIQKEEFITEESPLKEAVLNDQTETIESALSWMENLSKKDTETEKLDDDHPDWVKALSELEQFDSDVWPQDRDELKTQQNDQESLTPDWLQALQIETTRGENTDQESELIDALDTEYEEISISEDLEPAEKAEDETIEEVLQTFSEEETDDLISEEIEELFSETESLTELIQMDGPEESNIESEIDELLEEMQQDEQTVSSMTFEEFSRIESEELAEIHEIDEPEHLEDETEELIISKSSQERLDSAKQAILKGKITEALEIYNEFIHAELILDQVIIDLQDALNNKYPIDINLWQALGDAQLRNNQLQEALDSYTKAEELLS